MKVLLLFVLLDLASAVHSQTKKNILALYTGKNDQAHISFVAEANEWLSTMASQNGFTYNDSRDWSKLNDDTLKKYEVVIFLDTRPDSADTRLAFERYMKNGGAWIGFHFAGFALTPSAYPQNWQWYHDEFLGAGEYVSNTWRPTSAVLRIEDSRHPIAMDIGPTFTSSPSEWYRWKKDLRQNPAIQILVSIDPQSFPLGTGPKPAEIWHEGYYPVVWTNTNYKMVYFNMGHNDIDYEGKTNKTLSHTFGNPAQDRLVMNALRWLMGSGN
jgi:hypothetical protein